MSEIIFIISLVIIAGFLYPMFRKRAKLLLPDQQVQQKLLSKHVVFYQRLQEAEKKRFLENIKSFLQTTRITGVKTPVEDLDRVLGYESDIKNWRKENLEKYFKTYYAPNNCIVVITGNVTADQVKKLAKQYMEPIPAQPPPLPVHIVEPEQTGERRVMLKRDVATPYLMIAYHVPETKHKDYYALDVLSEILSRGNSSRLYSALVDQQELATDIGASMPFAFDPFTFNIYAQSTDSDRVAKLEEGIYTEIDKIKKEGITQRELQKIKNNKLMDFYAQVETINGKSNNIGNYQLFFGDYKKMFEAPAEYNKVTIEDVRRVANEYFKKTNRTVGILKTNVED